MSDEVEKEKPTYSNFLSAAMEFMAARPDATVLILMESPRGVETFRNTNNPVWCSGILTVAGHVLGAHFAQARNVEAEQRAEEIERGRIEDSMKKDKEKAN